MLKPVSLDKAMAELNSDNTVIHLGGYNHKTDCLEVFTNRTVVASKMIITLSEPGGNIRM